MQPYFIREIVQDIFLITEPWYREHASLYLFDGGDRQVLVDCGLGVTNIYQFLQSCGWMNVDVVLTHTHYDHAGGVWSVPPQHLLLTQQQWENLHDRSLWGLQYLRVVDFDADATPLCTGKNPEEICDGFTISVDPLVTSEVTYEVAHINVGRFQLSVLSASGHTDDSVVLYDVVHRILVSGDTLYDGEVYTNFLNYNADKMRDTLCMLRSLNVDLLLPGHNQVLEQPAIRFLINAQLRDL